MAGIRTFVAADHGRATIEYVPRTGMRSARCSSHRCPAVETDGIDGLATSAAALERSRDLDRGSLAVIGDRREAARAAERAESCEAAAKVEAKLMLTLALLPPALMLLVVIPLF